MFVLENIYVHHNKNYLKIPDSFLNTLVREDDLLRLEILRILLMFPSPLVSDTSILSISNFSVSLFVTQGHYIKSSSLALFVGSFSSIICKAYFAFSSFIKLKSISLPCNISES